MAVLRLYPTRYSEETGATYQNIASVLNGLNPEDASNYFTYAALVYQVSGFSHYTAKVNFYFTLPANIDDLDVTSIVAKGKIASYGGRSTSCGEIFLETGSLNFTATADHYSSAANAQAYMASSSYKTTPSITGSTLRSMLTKLKNGDSILKVQSYNDTSAPTYVSGVVLEIEYTPKDDQIKIGTSLLKKVKIGASQKIDKIFKGNTLLFKDKLLPKEYQEVEYVTFHGTNSGTSSTEYIDTGIVPSATKGFFLDADVTGASGCTGWGSGANNAATIFRGSSTGLRIQADNVSAAKTYSVTGRHVWTIDYYNQKMGYDNTLDSISPAQYGVLNFYLGAWYEGGTTFYGMGGNVYSFKIYDSGNLSVNYVPCYRKSDGVIGFYDTVNNVFKINNGGGTFTKGPDV